MGLRGDTGRSRRRPNLKTWSLSQGDGRSVINSFSELELQYLRVVVVPVFVITSSSPQYNVFMIVCGGAACRWLTLCMNPMRGTVDPLPLMMMKRATLSVGPLGMWTLQDSLRGELASVQQRMSIV